MTIPLKTRILVADDHPIVLKGLTTVLNAQADLEVIAEAADGEQAVDRAITEDVHLAILDISMPRKTGLQAAREITQRRPEVRVLMLSMHDNEQYLFEAIRMGASGYVLKSAVDRDLVEACRAAMRGEPFLYPGAVRALMREYLERARAGDALHDELLTPREEEIVKLVAEAHTNDEIGALLHISKKTVERHRANVLEKLGMRRADALRDPPRACPTLIARVERHVHRRFARRRTRRSEQLAERGAGAARNHDHRACGVAPDDARTASGQHRTERTVSAHADHQQVDAVRLGNEFAGRTPGREYTFGDGCLR
jgi:DNA-binding NarL/FixJ family response regulator